MRKVFPLIIMFVLSVSAMSAQTKFEGQVELLELDETTATFHAEGTADKKKEVIENAKMTVFYQLFYNGVEGFNDGKPLVERNNKFYLSNFFKGETRAPYNLFVKGAQLEGELDKLPTDEYHGYANVIVNTESLMRALKINKIYGVENDTTRKDTVRPTPKRGFRPLGSNKD